MHKRKTEGGGSTDVCVTFSAQRQRRKSTLGCFDRRAQPVRLFAGGNIPRHKTVAGESKYGLHGSGKKSNLGAPRAHHERPVRVSALLKQGPRSRQETTTVHSIPVRPGYQVKRRLWKESAEETQNGVRQANRQSKVAHNEGSKIQKVSFQKHNNNDSLGAEFLDSFVKDLTPVEEGVEPEVDRSSTLSSTEISQRVSTTSVKERQPRPSAFPLDILVKSKRDEMITSTTTSANSYSKTVGKLQEELQGMIRTGELMIEEGHRIIQRANHALRLIGSVGETQQAVCSENQETEIADGELKTTAPRLGTCGQKNPNPNPAKFDALPGKIAQRNVIQTRSSARLARKSCMPEMPATGTERSPFPLDLSVLNPVVNNEKKLGWSNMDQPRALGAVSEKETYTVCTSVNKENFPEELILQRSRHTKVTQLRKELIALDDKNNIFTPAKTPMRTASKLKRLSSICQIQLEALQSDCSSTD